VTRFLSTGESRPATLPTRSPPVATGADPGVDSPRSLLRSRSRLPSTPVHSPTGSDPEAGSPPLRNHEADHSPAQSPHQDNASQNSSGSDSGASVTSSDASPTPPPPPAPRTRLQKGIR
jgi:hypothetical protein